MMLGRGQGDRDISADEGIGDRGWPGDLGGKRERMEKEYEEWERKRPLRHAKGQERGSG